MGQAANLGLTIGVLTGVGTHDDLTHADVIVNDVSEVVDLISPHKDSKDFHSVTVTTRGLSKIAQRSSLIEKWLNNFGYGSHDYGVRINYCSCNKKFS